MRENENKEVKIHSAEVFSSLVWFLLVGCNTLLCVSFFVYHNVIEYCITFVRQLQGSLIGINDCLHLLGLIHHKRL